MKKSSLLILLLSSLLLPILTFADTTISGAISTNTTWSPLLGGVYIIDSSFSVSSGVTLTIEPGTIIKARTTGMDGPSIYGTLRAQGTSELPIYFTSIWDDSIGGDTDGNGPSVSTPGEWQGLYFKGGSVGDLDHVVVQYSGYGGYGYGNFVGIENDGGTLDIKNSNIHDNYRIVSNGAGGTMSAGSGIYNKSGTFSLSDSIIEHQATGVYIISGTSTITRNIIRNHFGTGFGANGEGPLILVDNIFSGNSGVGSMDIAKPFIHSGNTSSDLADRGFVITGIARDGMVLESTDLPILVFGRIMVEVGKTMTIAPGTVLKFGGWPWFGAMEVYGTLIAHGTATDKIYFTSIHDDSIGGDTNGNGDTTTPAPRNWNAVFLENGSEASFDNVVLRYSGYNFNGEYLPGVAAAIYNRGANLSISNSYIGDNFGTSIFQDGGTTLISQSELTNSHSALMLRSGDAVINRTSIHDHIGWAIDNQSGILFQFPEIKIIDARNNWWGSVDGPQDTSIPTPTGSGDKVSANVLYEPWLSADPTAQKECCSSVLFLPGIMGSRLFEGGAKRWEPSGDSDIERLYLNSQGESLYSVATGSVIETFDAPGPINPDIYKSFLNDLAQKKLDGTITDYAAYSYDWRLSLPNILADGVLEQVLRDLASSSQTGKVVIVAHSNGGLVAKALINALAEGAPGLVDQLILVGVPQLGTPKAIGALLHGLDNGIPLDGLPLVLSPFRARDFAQNAPFAYNLLPHDNYSNNPGFSISTPIITFGGGEATQIFRETYGNEIYSGTTLRNFILGTDGRAIPVYRDLVNPAKGNSELLQDAVNQQSLIGSLWQIPNGIKVHQIGGVGILTVAGLEYRTFNFCLGVIKTTEGWYCNSGIKTLGYRVNRVIDGDKTVIEPSTLAMPISNNVTRWWVDLAKYNAPIIGINRDHKNLLEIPDLRSLILNNLMGTSTTSYTYVSDTKPDLGTSDRLSFTLNSPLSLSYTESDGTVVNETNPYGQYSEYARYGEVQIIDIFAGETGTITMNGEDTGSFTLEIEQIQGNQVVGTTTYSAIPSSTTTIATVEVSGDTILETGDLMVNYDGDDTIDFTLSPVEGEEVSLPTAPITEETFIELIDQLLSYIDTNVSNKQTKKLLTQQLINLKKIYEKQEELKAKFPHRAHLFHDNHVLKSLVKVLNKQIDVYVKAKKLDLDTAAEIKRLLELIQNKL
ncbi:MAG: hypothetical protein A2829_02185 [Candidatus Zambryskibacteria bacterium RIFCSPHIGHO2_01_FULL_43_60]|nr:MAG: hypothetical protein A2829_02185 [Candidatus Zambryskibacteria bacterium RIFCSPHIGHO2_01_FULL_43_60]